jgi:hypothetical protein
MTEKIKSVSGKNAINNHKKTLKKYNRRLKSSRVYKGL